MGYLISSGVIHHPDIYRSSEGRYRAGILPRLPGIPRYSNLPITARHGAKMPPDFLILLHNPISPAGNVNLSLSGGGG